MIHKCNEDLFTACMDPLLPVQELQEAISPLAGRIPLDVFATITDRLQHLNTKKLVQLQLLSHGNPSNDDEEYVFYNC